MRKAFLRLSLVLIALVLLCSCRTQTIVYGDPGQSDVAMLFYPGGKVDPNAYYPILEEVSEEGIPVIVAKMPLDLAVLDGNIASRIVREYPNVRHWFLAGHSLGGVMASSWSARHTDIVDGVILLASYPTKKLAMPVMSVYGSNDGVLNLEKYHKGMERISDLEEHVIEGGNHCQFGDYGFQKGDNEATITRQEQTSETVDLILSFISRSIST